MAELSGLEALRGLHVDSTVVGIEPGIALGVAIGIAAAAIVIMLARARPLRARPLRVRAVRRALRTSLALARAAPREQQLVAQATLLRRAARTVAGEEVARLRGEAWLAALDRIFRTRFFTAAEGRCFADDLYAASPAADPEVTGRTLAGLARRLRS
jgi:hypothetical protein